MVILTSEARSSDRIVLLNQEAVLRYALTVVLASGLVFAAYAVVVYLLCNAESHWLAAVTLVGFQLFIGMYLVKKYHELGAVARGKWRFQDCSILGTGWHTEQEPARPEDIQRLFERWYAIASKHDTERLDDFTDLGWFAIVLQAVLTGALFLFGSITTLVCLISTVTLALVTAAMFVDGYRNRLATYMEDDIGHLEYLVRGRLAAFDAGASGCAVSDLILWSKLGSTSAVCDLGKTIAGDSALTSHVVLTYWVGLSAAGRQRFEIHTDMAPETLVPRLSAIPSISSRKWTVEAADGRVLVSEPSRSIRLEERASFVVSPAERDSQFSLVRSALAELLDRLGLVCLQHNLNEASSMLP